MKRLLLMAAAATALCATPALAADKTIKPEKSETPVTVTPPPVGGIFEPESVTSGGQVTVEGRVIDYRAVAGTLVVHPKGWDDTIQKVVAAATGDKAKEEASGDNPRAEASMFYVAYFKKGVPARDRPITFLYNGGPGLLDRVAAHGRLRPAPGGRPPDDTHTPAAPYSRGRQRLQPARRLRPGVHRRAGHGLFAHRRQGQGKGLLGRRRRRPRLRRVHPGIPVQVRPLELTQISVRRELRHAALGGAGQ